MQGSTMKPEIRFNGFTDDWEQHRLPEFTEFCNGLTYTPNDVQDKGTLVLRSSNVNNGEIVDADNVYVNPEVVDCPNVNMGDVIVVVRNGSRSLIGKHAQIKRNMPNTVIGAFMADLKSEVPSFLNALLDTPHFDSEVATNMGATINQITGYMFAKMEFLIPSKDEQEVIGTFFENLDDLIALHQCKCSQILSIKQSMLEKMFPQDGTKTPEIRFSGFTEKWEHRKLGDLGEFNPKAELPDTFEYVDLESVVGTEMIDHRTETKKSAPSRAQRLAQQGDLFYQTVRPYQRNNYLFEKADSNYVFSTGYTQIRPYCDGYFLLSLVQNDLFLKNVLDRCTGTGYPAINSNDLAEIEVYIPSDYKEQEKVGSVFKDIDNLIALHQHKLDQLQCIKKFCLEKMFVS